MKTFDEKDLITWANRDKAVIGNEYYFSDSLNDLRIKIKDTIPVTLISIDKNHLTLTFKDEHLTWYACILPANKVIDESEKKHRACKNIRELHNLVNDCKRDIGDNVCIDELIGKCIIHYRSKNTGREFYSLITSIIKHEDGYLVYFEIGYFLSELFDNFEIEINGKWQPFGVLEK